jgi:P27 family predicted phage terminase small subunit
MVAAAPQFRFSARELAGGFNWMGYSWRHHHSIEGHDMPGPAPLPTRLKLMRGNPGHEKLNRDEPQPPVAPRCPEPPEGLTGDARATWAYQAPRLHRLGLLTEVDGIAFEIYCRLVGRWRAIERQLDDAGVVVPGPYLTAAREAARAVLAAGAEFGLSPSARVRVRAGDPPRDSKWDGLLA